MIIKKYKDGEYRYKWKFFFLPTYFDGYLIWLEKRYVRQIYLTNNMLVRGWYDVCLSDPKTKLPLDINKLNG